MHIRSRSALLLTLPFAIAVLAGDPASTSPNDSPFSVLPIWGEQAREKGYDLPLPVGVGVSFMNIWQDYDIKDVQFTPLVPLPFPIGGVEVSRAEGDGYSLDGRVDVWLFPFLNVYGVLGYTKGDSGATATIPGLGNLQFPFVLDYEGVTFGGGATVAYAYKQLFASVDYNYTLTDLDIADSKITAHVVTPRVGWHGDLGGLKGAAWIGTMYQGIAQEFRGQLSVSVPGLPGPIPVRYAVDQEATDPWNLIFGIEWQISPHWDFVVEGGVLGREQVLTSLTFRF
jgi:hypothetical protein